MRDLQKVQSSNERDGEVQGIAREAVILLDTQHG